MRKNQPINGRFYQMIGKTGHQDASKNRLERQDEKQLSKRKKKELQQIGTCRGSFFKMMKG